MKRFLQHLFVPHESNNHRSRLLHHDSLLLIITFLFAGLIVVQGTHRQYPAVLGDATSISSEDLLKYTNIQRQANGLVPLRINRELTQAAKLKAHDMFAKDYWAHVAPDGTTPWVFIKDSGYEYLYAGENLARGFTTSAGVVDAWMNSPSHRENLLSPHYTDIGFAIESGSLTGTETVLVVQEFGSPYTSKDTTTDAGQFALLPSPVPTVFVAPGTAQPTTSPSPSEKVYGNTQVNEPRSLAGVAAAQNKPLIDATSVKRNMSFFFLALFLVVLAIDAIIIERKKIVRIFSHNVDHILFLLFILLAGILIGRGVIL